MGKPKVKMKLVIGKVYYFDESKESFGKYLGLVATPSLTNPNAFSFRVIEIDDSRYKKVHNRIINFSIDQRNRFILKA